MGKRLSKEVVNQRMVEWFNLRKLLAAARRTIAKLRAEKKADRERIHTLEREVADLKDSKEALAMQMAELQTMVFGKSQSGKNDDRRATRTKPAPRPRKPESYRRVTPTESEITDTKILSLPTSCSCGGDLKQPELLERFVEDILLPALTDHHRARRVTRYQIPRAVCKTCRRVTVGVGDQGQPFNLSGSTVSLGSNIRLLVCHLVTIGLSYSQVAHLMLVCHGLTISSGEIAAILAKQKVRWMAAYRNLADRIRAAPYLHIDETSWKIKTEAGGNAWVMSAGNSNHTLFKLAPTRGAPIAQKLLRDYKGVRITDGYAAYQNSNLLGQHQRCWAHLQRKISDLRYNRHLPNACCPHVVACYEKISAIYKTLRDGLKQPFDAQQRQALSDQLWHRVQRLAASQPRSGYQPKTLIRLKNELLKAGQSSLFVCLITQTPCDNNRAERDLRSLVLKRKRSFGSQTQKGASALEVILSLCTTTYRQYPNSYFKALASL